MSNFKKVQSSLPVLVRKSEQKNPFLFGNKKQSKQSFLSAIPLIWSKHKTYRRHQTLMGTNPLKVLLSVLFNEKGMDGQECEAEHLKNSILAMESEESVLISDAAGVPQIPTVKGWKWWFLVILNIGFLLIGQAVAVILGKLYYDKGGKSNWMATLVQTAAFPILFIPLLFFPSQKSTATSKSSSPSFLALVLMYIVLGALMAGDNMLYSLGLLYLPMSTYALLTATQLVFNSILAYFLNAQKLTFLIVNSVALLTLSAILVAVHSDDSTDPKKYSKENHIIGFFCTVLASAVYALLLCLMQISFEKVIKRETFSVVLDMQIYTSLVASCVCLVGLFASGEAWHLKQEMEEFEEGKAVYVVAVVGSALAWQVCSVGVVGLIFLVSSLFSNVISMFNLPLVPVAGALFYGESMDSQKIVAMLLAVIACSSYMYQQYLDDVKPQAEQVEATATSC